MLRDGTYMECALNVFLGRRRVNDKAMGNAQQATPQADGKCMSNVHDRSSNTYFYEEKWHFAGYFIEWAVLNGPKLVGILGPPPPSLHHVDSPSAAHAHVCMASMNVMHIHWLTCAWLRNLTTYKAKRVAAKKGFELLKKKADALKMRFQLMLREIQKTKMAMSQEASDAFFSLSQAQYAAGDFRHKVIESVTTAEIRLENRIDNVAGVKLPVFTEVES
ncbi:hypothetical protein AaE_009235, partial [Aphanomyces astaci]